MKHGVVSLRYTFAGDSSLPFLNFLGGLQRRKYLETECVIAVWSLNLVPINLHKYNMALSV